MQYKKQIRFGSDNVKPQMSKITGDEVPNLKLYSLSYIFNKSYSKKYYGNKSRNRK